jgi:hypothetical protein
MTVSELRRELKKRIDHLKEDRLRSAADYLAYLDEGSSPIALAMRKRLRKAEREIAEGLVTPVSKLSRKY